MLNRRIHRSSFVRFVVTAILCGCAAGTFAEGDVSLTSHPYRASGLFADVVLPTEGQEIGITVRAQCREVNVDSITIRLTIRGPRGGEVRRQDIVLQRRQDTAEGTWPWVPPTNGLYRITAQLDPANTLAETDEGNNRAELLLPVLVSGRNLHFAWYRDDLFPDARWATCITSTQTDVHTLAERGIKPLAWVFGGLTWSAYDKELLASAPDRFWQTFEDGFARMYSTAQGEHVVGFGIDETGGYPGTFGEQASAASMRGLVRAREQRPDRFFAVWHGGGVRRELAQHYRKAVDLLLLETYLWRAIPEDLGTEDIYQTIRDRLDPFIRATDMILPAYGSPCHTLIGLDTSERADRIDLGEQEEVIRYIRRICPEMRGLGFYNAGYGGYGITRTDQTDRHHRAVLANADRLCFDYFVKPCLTLMPRSLWLRREADGWVLIAAVSNIGGMDSGAVTVEFRIDGDRVGQQQVGSVPAGPNRNHNRALLKQRVHVRPGPHAIEARIVSAGEATVLDPRMTCERYVN